MSCRDEEIPLQTPIENRTQTFRSHSSCDPPVIFVTGVTLSRSSLVLEPGIDVGHGIASFPEGSGNITIALQRSTCNNVFQVLLQAQAKRDDGQRSFLCSQLVIIPSVSDTCAQGVIVNFNGVRQDQDEVDVPAKGFRGATTWDRVCWRIVTRRPGREHSGRQTRNSMQRSVRSHAVLAPLRVHAKLPHLGVKNPRGRPSLLVPACRRNTDTPPAPFGRGARTTVLPRTR